MLDKILHLLKTIYKWSLSYESDEEFILRMERELRDLDFMRRMYAKYGRTIDLF